jgi:HK97 gp10 family phage protein
VSPHFDLSRELAIRTTSGSSFIDLYGDAGSHGGKDSAEILENAMLRFDAGTFNGTKAKRAAEKALLQAAADVVDVAKQLSPVDTGRLKQSLGAVPLSSSRIRVGTAVEYGKYVEYGTVNSAAQPFLTPAMAQAPATFEKRLKDALAQEFTDA